MFPTFVIVPVIAAALAFGSAWQIQDWRYDAKEKVRLEKVREDQKMREKSVVTASSSYEKKKEIVRIKYVKVVEEVDKIVERPVYLNVCIDEDGVKAINQGIEP